MAAYRSPSNSIILDNIKCVDFINRRITPCTLHVERGVIKAKTIKRAHLPKGIPVCNLRGRFVIPGFIDAHTHLIATGIEMQRLDLSRCRSLDECLQKIRANMKNHELVFASNWDEYSWQRDERERLDKHMLDRISKSKPIIMRRICGHYAVVNSAAVQRISKQWKIVDRKRGRLYEDVVSDLNDIFTPTDEMLRKAVGLATHRALRLGITSVHEISNPRRFRIMQQLRRKLKMRFAIYLPVKYHKHLVASGLRTGYGDDWLKFMGTKVYVDGAMGARTAALWRPFTDTHGRGKILITMRKLAKIVQSAEKHSLQLMIHSIGDRATSMVLEVLREYITPGNPLRHRLEHLELLKDASVADIGRLKIIASMQPNFVRRWQNPGGMYDQILGSRYTKMNCFKSLLRARARVVFGSDCMPLGPLYGIEGAVGHPSGRGKLHIADAFRLYTAAGAHGTFDEKKKGKIEPGYFADLVVIDKNPLEERNLGSLKIDSVMVAGHFVYKRALL
ncbi:amidohydrolase family protein [candidate division WOR-3 bacterium]|nr:amidohydrolase family protein [candidate division WOR-3 bacterium]